MKSSVLILSVLVPALTAFACGESKTSNEPPATPDDVPTQAEAGPLAPDATATPSEPPVEEEAASAPAKSIEVALLAKSGSKLTGKVTFTETSDGVHVAFELENVSLGDHGTHVHEKGDCSAPDAASAGGHFNPHAHDHGLPAQHARHLGDLGNITVDKDGKGKHEITVAGANLKDSDPNSFVGRAVIIHEKKDDGGQPTGNAGGRIGCGTIQ